MIANGQDILEVYVAGELIAWSDLLRDELHYRDDDSAGIAFAATEIWRAQNPNVAPAARLGEYAPHRTPPPGGLLVQPSPNEGILAVRDPLDGEMLGYVDVSTGNVSALTPALQPIVLTAARAWYRETGSGPHCDRIVHDADADYARLVRANPSPEPPRTGSSTATPPPSMPAAGSPMIAAVRDVTVQIVSALAGSVLVAWLGLGDPSRATQVVVGALVAAIAAAIVAGFWGSRSAFWRTWRTVVATVLVFVGQVLLALVGLAAGSPVATRKQVRAQANLISRTGEGRVIWSSKVRASRNIDRLIKRVREDRL